VSTASDKLQSPPPDRISEANKLHLAYQYNRIGHDLHPLANLFVDHSSTFGLRSPLARRF
jgi:hypothetical protein